MIINRPPPTTSAVASNEGSAAPKPVLANGLPPPVVPPDDVAPDVPLPEVPLVPVDGVPVVPEVPLVPPVVPGVFGLDGVLGVDLPPTSTPVLTQPAEASLPSASEPKKMKMCSPASGLVTSTDPDGAATRALRARELFEERFTVRSSALRLLDVYRWAARRTHRTVAANGNSSEVGR